VTAVSRSPLDLARHLVQIDTGTAFETSNRFILARALLAAEARFEEIGETRAQLHPVAGYIFTDDPRRIAIEALSVLRGGE
jgi:hypothetical protein